MTTFKLLKGGLTATTNPAANTLAVQNPFALGDKFITNGASTAWKSQSNSFCPALFLIPGQKQGQRLNLVFVPSNANATYTITVWRYIPILGTWVSYFANGSNNYTGLNIDWFENLDDSPLLFQLSNISAGTVSIYYDSDLASAA